MKKLTGLFLAVVMFAAVASPALAADPCTIVKVEGSRFARVRMVCNVSGPAVVNETVTAQSDNGKARTTSTVRINTSGNGSASVSVKSFVSASGGSSASSSIVVSSVSITTE